MTLPVRAITLFTACLIALSATALPSDVIDVFGLPLPRLVLGMSWFTSLAVAAIVILLPMQHDPMRRVLGAWDAAYVGTLLIWALFAAGRGEPLRGGALAGILAWFPPWLTSVAVRLHVRQFGHADLVAAFVNIVAALALVHLAGLLAVKVGIVMPFIRPDELIDRNAISILVVAAAFLMMLHDMLDRHQPSWWFVGLIALGFVHAKVNGTRSAELLLVIVLTLQIARVTVLRERLVILVCAIACAGIVITVIGLGALMDWIRQPELFGGGDSAASATHRSEANRELLRLVFLRPWVGVGWEEVLYARSGGYIGHTLYLVMVAAYGLVALVPVVAATIWRRLVRRAAFLTSDQAMTAVLVTITASFVNDPLGWYGLVLPLCSSMSLRNAVPAWHHERALRVRRVTLDNILTHLRGTYIAGAAAGMVCFAILAGWLLLRDRYVATSELEIALTGATALESSRDADKFIQDTVLRNNPELRNRCSVRPLVERQAVIVTCKGKTHNDAVLGVNDILSPLANRHATLFEARLRAAELKAEVEGMTLQRLTDWAASLDTRREPIVGSRVDVALLSFLNHQRATLIRSLQLYERGQRRVHPTVVNGPQVVQRRQPWLLALAFSVMAMCGVGLALAVGRAARTARSSAP